LFILTASAAIVPAIFPPTIPEAIPPPSIPMDSFIANYLQAKKKAKDENVDFSTESFVKDFNDRSSIVKLPSRDYMFQQLKIENGKSETNPDGFSDDDINKHLNSLDPIELKRRADASKKEWIEKEKVRNEQLMGAVTKVSVEDIQKFNGKMREAVNPLLKLYESVETIGGLPHGKSEREEFSKVFSSLMEVNPETTKTRLQEYLNDDKILYEALFLHWAADKNRIDTYLSKFKEEYKAKILKQTGLAGDGGGAGGGINIPRGQKPDDYL